VVPEANEPVTATGLDDPEVLKAIEGELVAVYEVIGSLEKLGAVNVTDTVVALVTVAVPIIGALGAPLVEPCTPNTGIARSLSVRSRRPNIERS
jgi:hypothetical protein